MDQRHPANLTPFLTILSLLALLVLLASLSVRAHSSRFYQDVPRGHLTLEGAGLASGGLEGLPLHEAGAPRD